MRTPSAPSRPSLARQILPICRGNLCHIYHMMYLKKHTAYCCVSLFIFYKLPSPQLTVTNSDSTENKNKPIDSWKYIVIE